MTGDRPLQPRGDLMRKIGVLYGKIALIDHGECTDDDPPVTRGELKQQIAALTKELMAL